MENETTFNNFLCGGNLTHGSLFSGIGGFEIGADKAGIETLWNCEFEEHNRNILMKHFSDTKQYFDVREMQSPGYVDIISGGFPCQDLSIANQSKKSFKEDGNKKGIDGERSGLWSEMWRIIADVRPRYVLIENSPMLVIRGLERVISDLARIGYVCEWQCLFASQFGYNHSRKRIFIIAYPSQERCEDNSTAFQELPKILQQRPPRQNPLSMPFKRFNRNSDYELLRMDDGFSKELDKQRIEMMGNAVVPDIAHYLFECIKNHIALKKQKREEKKIIITDLQEKAEYGTRM